MSGFLLGIEFQMIFFLYKLLEMKALEIQTTRGFVHDRALNTISS